MKFSRHTHKSKIRLSVYCTSLLATLNCRSYISQIGSNNQSYQLTTVVFTSNIRSPQSPEMAPGPSPLMPHFGVVGQQVNSNDGRTPQGISFGDAPRSLQFRSPYEVGVSADKFVSPVLDGGELAETSNTTVRGDTSLRCMKALSPRHNTVKTGLRP